MSQRTSCASGSALAKRRTATLHISPAAPMKTTFLLISVLSGRSCCLRSERADDFLGGALAGTDGAVHVPLEVDAGLRPGPVDAAADLARGVAVARHQPGRTRADAALDPRLVRPVLLEVPRRVGRLGPPQLHGSVDERRPARRRIVEQLVRPRQPRPLAGGAHERHEDADAPVGRRIVRDVRCERQVAVGLTVVAVGAPERRVVDEEVLTLGAVLPLALEDLATAGKAR